MNSSSRNTFGTSFERIFMSLISITTGIILIYLAVKGPLLMNQIRYKTADILYNQLIGQDLVNIFLSIILISGGIALFLRKSLARYLLIMTPLYLIYYTLSYTIGWEWSSPRYTGNNEMYTFYFLFILIAALMILLYSLMIFPREVASVFKKKDLILYSVIFSLFLLVFASMWIKEISEVMTTGTARAYDIAPTAFWLVRIFDLGFSIPLGLMSVYLLWIRPQTTYAIQFLFYGFFITMIIAVNAMGVSMYLRHDPTFMMRDLVVFLVLMVIIVIGFIFIQKNYRIKN